MRRNELRRSDRSKEWEWASSELGAGAWATFAWHDGEGVRIHSNLYIWDGERGALYFHGAREGALPSSLAGPVEAVCQVSRMGRILPAATALAFSVEYAAVEVRGAVAPVTDAAESRRALERLLEKYAPQLEAGRDYRPITAGELERTAVYRLDVAEWSAKENAADKAPNAFPYERP